MRRPLAPFLFFLALGGCAREEPTRVSQKVFAEGTFTYEVYSNRSLFEARVRVLATRTVDFDDIATSGPAAASFDAERYATRGVVISGEKGQYAHPDFGWPGEIVPTSPPNAYAPGPREYEGGNGSGNETTVTFVSEHRTARTAAFGATFLDADPNNWAYGWSSIVFHDVANDPSTSTHVKIGGKNASQAFAGLIVFGEDGAPSARISKVVLANGDGWPGLGNEQTMEGNAVSGQESAAIDDLLFAPPVPVDSLP